MMIYNYVHLIGMIRRDLNGTGQSVMFKVFFHRFLWLGLLFSSFSPQSSSLLPLPPSHSHLVSAWVCNGKTGQQLPRPALRGHEGVKGADLKTPQLHAHQDTPTQQDQGGGVHHRVGVVVGEHEAQ